MHFIVWHFKYFYGMRPMRQPDMIKTFAALLLIFFGLTVTAQGSRVVLNGKVSLDHTIVEDIYVFNVQSSKGVSTVAGGYFTLQAQVGDTIMFSAINIIGKRIVLADEDLSQDLLIVRLELMPNMLNEVKIFNYDHINAVTLGIIPAGQRSYTSAERKFKAGADFDAKVGTSSSVSGDAIFNWMSGRAAMLKKELVVEQYESKQEKLERMFDAKYIEQKLLIPADYVRGFMVFVAEQATSAIIFNSKDRNAAAFALSELAITYKAIIGVE